jgi:hypothetical protein
MTLGERWSSEDDNGDGSARISRGWYLPLSSTIERLSSERHDRRHDDGAPWASPSLRSSSES